jgi:hypothetical protein
VKRERERDRERERQRENESRKRCCKRGSTFFVEVLNGGEKRTAITRRRRSFVFFSRRSYRKKNENE